MNVCSPQEPLSEPPNAARKPRARFRLSASAVLQASPAKRLYAVPIAAAAGGLHAYQNERTHGDPVELNKAEADELIVLLQTLITRID